MSTFTHIDTFTVIHCWKCGVAFGLTVDFDNRRRNDHEGFACPMGHWNYYSAKSEAEKLRDELAREKHRTEQATADARWWREAHGRSSEREAKTERRLRATKAVVTRTKKKIVAGRCPCCSHKFKDLAMHMTTRHPNYDPEKAATALEAKEAAR